MEMLLISNNTWDVELVQGLFCEEDARAILGIPRTRGQSQDKLIWHYEKNDFYTIKSGYNLACSLKGVASSSDAEKLKQWWKFVWSRKIPNKIKVFCWRLYHDYLPSVKNLNRRGMEVQTGCPRCNLKEESTFHAIWECRAVKLIWKESPFYPRPGPVSIQSTTDLLWWCWAHMPSSLFEEFVVLCWWIWNRRNKELFGGRQGSEVEDGVWGWVSEYLTQFRAFQGRKESIGARVREVAVWRPPIHPNYSDCEK